jgi:V/A-type H+/Na+-transporting ATPase subunit I
MIVKMKQITLLVSNRDRGRALERLRNLGVMHIKRKKFLSSGEISFLEDKLAIFEKAIEIISGSAVKEAQYCPEEKIPSFIEEIEFLAKDRAVLEERLNLIKKDIDWYRDWGPVSLDAVSSIKDSGLELRVAVLSKEEFKRLSDNQSTFLIKRDRSKFYTAFIADSQSIPALNFMDIPKREYSTLIKESEEVARELQEVDQRVEYLSGFKSCFNDYKEFLNKKLDFARVNSELDISEGFSSIEGFVPVDALEALSGLSDKEGWGLILREPDNPEEVPTLIRNPRWLRIIEPVFKLMDTIPGYEEYDISLWFLIFFSLFFAMIVGDGGYGLVFLAAAFLIRRKKKDFSKQILCLIYSLSFATIFWGAITGNWFGVESLSQAPLLNLLVVESLNSFIDSNQSNLIYLCFVIGIIHLSIAHLVAALRYINSTKFISHIGWISIGWAMFLLSRDVVLNKGTPKILPFLLIGGALAVILFSKPQKNLFKRMLSALFDLPFSIINFFADILSYLRLFAVGYASVMIAITFNNMASDIGFDKALGFLIAVVIIIFGHSLNILLALMSVLVHGVRLNVLEFSTHLDLEWKGKSYKPFKD